MINPGFILLIAAGISYFLKKNIHLFILSLISTTTVLFYLFFAIPFGEVPFGEALITYEFLHFDLIIFQMSKISYTLAIIFVIFSFCGFLYSYKYASKKFYMLVSAISGSSVSIIFVGDFFSFLVLWEVMNILTFFLVYDMKNETRRKIAQYFFMIQLFGGMSMLLGVVLHYDVTGSLVLTNAEAGEIFFLIAICIKMAFIGVHTWLPKTYTTVPFYNSVLLSAFTTKIGAYGLYHILGGSFIVYAGTLNALIGVFLALQQPTIRKILCYHIISQMGYIIVGVGLHTHVGNVAGFFHIINNILYKGLLFMMAGAVIKAVGTEELKNLGGLWKKMPVTFAVGMIASLSISGVPFFSGYLSKALIKAEVNSQFVYYGLFIAGIGTALSFSKIMYFTFLRTPKQEVEIKNDIDFTLKLSMSLVAAVIMFIALNPYLMESSFGINSGLDYFSFYRISGGAEPVIIALLLFPLLKKSALKPHADEGLQADFYNWIADSFVNSLCRVLSRMHTGDEVRYISWVVMALLFFLFNIYLINNIIIV